MERLRPVNTGGRGAGGAPMLVCYFPVGDPAVPVELLDLYADNGVDVVELGLPSRRPRLDGPVVAASMERALAAGETGPAIDGILDRLARRTDAPSALLMGYGSGVTALMRRGGGWPAGVSVLVVEPPDDPVRTAAEEAARGGGGAVACFVPVQATADDVAAARAADAYVMLQAAAGVTGPRPAVDIASEDRLAALRREGVTAPVVLGFGISHGAHAADAVRLGADGVVVGSACLRAALDGPAPLEALLSDLRRALDAHG